MSDEVTERIINGDLPLSEDQKKAVLSKKKHVRVIAGAGAGKTETLTRKIIHLILAEDVDPSSIVAFTFTEKAAQNMKSRIYHRILQYGREDVAKHLGEMYVGTIHAFCLQLLQDKFGYGNYTILDDNQEMAFIMHVGWDLGLGNGGFYAHNCEVFLNSVNVVYSEELDRGILKDKAPYFYKKLLEYEKLLEDNRRLTFGKIIYDCVLKLKENREAVDYIKYLIVDEFQDIDKTQFDLIKIIGEQARVFVVGDPRQSIYQWRGSNEKFFHEFSNYFPDTELVEIKENRRSTKKIVYLSNDFSQLFEGVSYEPLEPVRKEEGEIVKLSFETDEEEAEWIADEIKRLVDEEGCKYSDFGILMRSVNTSAGPFINAFKKRKIPYIVGGKVGLFKRPEAQAIGRILAWATDYDGKKGFWQENPYNYHEKTTGDELLSSGLNYWKEAVDFQIDDERVKKELFNWKERVLNGDFKSFKEMYHRLLIILGYHNFDPSNPLHSACMANLGRISGLLRDFEIAIRIHKGQINWPKEMYNLCWFINTYASKKYEEQLPDDIRSIDAVQLMTVHQAKGLEWPIVFIPAMVNKRFPSSMAGRRKEWYIPRDMFDVKRYEGGIEDEKRLFYVAITRAKDKLVISYFNQKSNHVSPSEFISALINHQHITTINNPYKYRIEYKPKEETEENEDILTFSTTELIDYMKCPYHYRLNKVWGYVQELSPLIGYGDAVHYCLRKAGEKIKNEGYDPITAVAESVEKDFFLPFLKRGAFFDKLKESVLDRLVAFGEKYKEDMRNIYEVESRLEFPVENATIAGKIDVILRDAKEETYEIRDYKTSDPKDEVITKEEAEFQVQLYTLGLRQADWKIDKGSIAYINENPEVVEVPVDETTVNSAKSKAEEIIRRIRSRDFTPRPSEFCNKCEYRDICRWRK